MGVRPHRRPVRVVSAGGAGAAPFLALRPGRGDRLCVQRVLTFIIIVLNQRFGIRRPEQKNDSLFPEYLKAIHKDQFSYAEET